MRAPAACAAFTLAGLAHAEPPLRVARLGPGTSMDVLNLGDRITQLQLTQCTPQLRVQRLGPNAIFEGWATCGRPAACPPAGAPTETAAGPA